MADWDMSHAVSSLQRADKMFAYCTMLTADLSKWDVSSATSHDEFNPETLGLIAPRAWQ